MGKSRRLLHWDPDAAEIAFVGPLLGSMARVIGGRLGDRFDGGRVTLAALTAMTAAGAFLVAVSTHDYLTRRPGDPVWSFTTIGYIVGFIRAFCLCGIGKGSVSSSSRRSSRSEAVRWTSATQNDGTGRPCAQGR